MRTKLKICSFLVLVLLLTLTESRRGGGGSRGGGSRSSSSRSGSSSWFGSRSSSSRSSSSSNSRSGSWAGSSSSRGSSGSNYPRQQYGSGGSRTSSGGGRTPIGGGGFVNPKVTSYGNSYGAKNTYSYKSPGYGTKFGTSFPGGVGKYGGKGFSKKALGLGVGAGFIGGAALGVAGTAATMGVYHRYMQYRFLTGGWGYNPYYYNHYYYGNNCWGGCPWNAHCEWGFCECNRGYFKRYGHCQREGEGQPRPAGFDPFKPCDKNATCLEMDLNLICNTNLTIQNVGKCECRENMRWNTEAGECQLYLDVDCSSVTYETKPSTVVLEAVNKTLDSLEGQNTTEINLSDPSKPENQTISASPNATLANSLLSSIDKDKASKQDIKEAYCRDVDSFSWELGKPERQRQYASGSSRSVGSIVGMVIGIIAITALCCCCCFCFCCKGAFDKIKKSFKSDKTYDDNSAGGMTFSNVHQSSGDQSYPPSYPAQPQGYDNAPPVIPPTQPGYSNYPPEYNTNTSPYPPQYPPSNQAPYPPVSQPVYPPQYPPVKQPPFNPGPNY